MVHVPELYGATTKHCVCTVAIMVIGYGAIVNHGGEVWVLMVAQTIMVAVGISYDGQT